MAKVSFRLVMPERELLATEADMVVVPGSEGAHTVFWPADGRSLYLTAKGKFLRMPLEGEGHVLLADSPSFMFSGTWLSPKQILLDSFQASYLIFSTPGCWEVNAQVGEREDSKITFVTKVVKIGDGPTRWDPPLRH